MMLRMGKLEAASLMLTLDLSAEAWDMLAAGMNQNMQLRDKHGPLGGMIPSYTSLQQMCVLDIGLFHPQSALNCPRLRATKL